MLQQQLEVLIYGVPSPHSVLLQKRDISIPNSQPAIRAPPQVLLASLGESVQFTAEEQLNLCSSTGCTPRRLYFRGTQRARLDLDQLLEAPGCATERTLSTP